MKRYLPFFLISAGVLLFVAASGSWFLEAALQNPTAAPLPGKIIELPLTSELDGNPAVSELTRMHGKGFPLTSAAIGMYGSEHQITIWVSGTPFTPITSRMTDSMRTRIAESNSPFTPVSERIDGKRTVFELEGMGQKQYYFQSGKLLVWMAAAPDLSTQALEQVLKFYP